MNIKCYKIFLIPPPFKEVKEVKISQGFGNFLFTKNTMVLSCTWLKNLNIVKFVFVYEYCEDCAYLISLFGRLLVVRMSKVTSFGTWKYQPYSFVRIITCCYVCKHRIYYLTPCLYMSLNFVKKSIGTLLFFFYNG